MKTLTTIAFALLICLTSSAVFAQANDAGKKNLFAAFPSKIEISNNTLQNLFTAMPGEKISIAFDGQFRFTGMVISNELKYQNLQSVLIRSEQFDNALLQVSKITKNDKSISYVGRIIHQNALDGYEIKKDLANNYRLQKFETKSILQDCSY